MQKFIAHFYPKTKTEVFSESCGVADLITTCFGGRNRKCAEAFAESRIRGQPRTWEDIETEMLNGQKIQGTLTAQEIMPLITHHRLESELPLMCATYNIAFKDASPMSLLENL
jgi:glycerol-3-phosphate dehydrogenase (NAD+)